MKNFRQELSIATQEEEEFLNLSYEVEECVRRSHISNGICVVYSQHTTSAIFLDQDNEMLYADWSKALGKLVEGETEYKVDYESAGAPHIKQILIGASVTIPISEGRLELGPRQYIMYADFSGCRDKSVIVKIIGE